MKLALLLSAVAPSVGGVLIMGERGTGKSTAVRALADLLPPLERVRGCIFNCAPADGNNLCETCAARLKTEGRLPRERAGVPVVELPLGATEDRVCGTINVERALAEGIKTFEPGLLARADRGFLYIDEVNLLEDHLVDLLLDAAATGRNKVEREGVSVAHNARFVLVGSGNPEEGELRPQLLDRFGLFTEVRTSNNIEERVEIVERSEAFERDREGFVRDTESEQSRLRRRLVRARRAAGSIVVPRPLVRLIAELCARLKVDGHRGELTIARASRALAALEGRRAADEADVRRVAPLALRHRLRRDPLEPTSSGGSRVDDALEEVFGSGDGERARGAARKFERTRLAQNPPTRDAGAGADGVVFDERHADGNVNPGDADGRDDSPSSRGDEKSVPAVDAHLPDVAFDPRAQTKMARGVSASNRTRGARGRSVEASAGGGRYVRAVTVKPASNARIAVEATLRTAVTSRVSPGGATNEARGLSVERSDIRYKQLRRKEGTLYVVAVDASGSMAANRIGQAKGALTHLLRHSYVKRDRVALISFREDEARVVLPPSGSHALAKRAVESLAVGGATPLPGALLRALEIVKRARLRGATRVAFIIFTDGRANVPLDADSTDDKAARKRQIKSEIERLGRALREADVSSVVVDTQNRFTSGGEGESLALALGGRCVYLPALVSETSIKETLALTRV